MTTTTWEDSDWFKLWLELAGHEKEENNEENTTNPVALNSSTGEGQ
jgi:hypothetical protein